MTELERKKGGGSKLSRSETVTVRLDPKLRYLAELAARKQRRTVSSFIEWAIEESLHWYNFYDCSPSSQTKSVAAEAPDLWDVDEADRFAKLAFIHPELMTHDEQITWKIIKECGYLWRGENNDEGEWTWTVMASSLIIESLRENWDLIKEVAVGIKGKDALPTMAKKKSIS